MASVVRDRGLHLTFYNIVVGEYAIPVLSFALALLSRWTTLFEFEPVLLLKQPIKNHGTVAAGDHLPLHVLHQETYFTPACAAVWVSSACHQVAQLAALLNKLCGVLRPAYYIPHHLYIYMLAPGQHKYGQYCVPCRTDCSSERCSDKQDSAIQFWMWVCTGAQASDVQPWRYLANTDTMK